ncbi:MULTISPECIES: hypothetical protein [unclassified Streptomyces]|uniref:hypothetical protein n=1 Tax=unclassified Streptomyces TaxID=2593676 RepID=UPI002ECFCB1C|nr:hypothetical protein OH827_19460 [Streptomyces sp. NBC_00891]WSY07045.1 hypothetical protein OG464_19460 [Streptomyces sp. NBC_00890]WSZ08671.1 hypothetical protein OG704_19460 [Streptomyces sp. NBC_00869]WSZ23830.1 hypothetical protein OG498_14105 [Streptomyces sp. NBC_00870]
MSPSQHEQRTDRTDGTRPAPARGPAPAERTGLLGVQSTLGNTAVLHLLRQAGHPYTAAPRGVAVQRFMEPTGSGDAWRTEALAYVQSEHGRTILPTYLKQTLGRKASREARRELLKELGMQEAAAVVSRAVEDGPAAAGPDLDKSLATVVRNLNIMEQENVTAAKAGEDPGQAFPLPNVLVGTEFTFTDGTLNGTVGGNPLRVDLSGLKGRAVKAAEAAIGYATKKMNDWALKVASAPLPKGVTLAVTATDIKGQAAKRFTYTADSTPWWWEITMDDGCLETRTAPTSVGGMQAGHVDFIIRRHIFELAEKSGLHVDQSIFGGGGHISVDSESAFGGSVELFVKSMRMWEEKWEKWVERFGDAPREKDTVNAPWTGDLPQGETHLRNVQELLTEILADAHRGDVDLPGAVRRLQAHMVALPLHRDATQNLREKVAGHPEDRLHYQAVNLEHMNAESAGSRRVEFRDIQAQQGYDQLMGDLRHIGDLLQDARYSVVDDQQTRLAKRHP